MASTAAHPPAPGLTTADQLSQLVLGGPGAWLPLLNSGLHLLVNLAIGAGLLALTLWAAGWASRLAREATGRLNRGHAPDAVLQGFVSSLARYGVIVIGLIAVLQQIGVQTTSVLAVLGAASLAIGLALQGGLSNVAAGVMLLLLRPYRIGDRVKIGEVVGRVHGLDLFVTRLHDLDFAADATPLLLRGGETLVAAGEPMKALYRLTAGRLGELTPTTDGGGRLLTVHRPGALIGGAQLLGGGVSRTTLTALRDSELESIEAKRAQDRLRADPDFLSEVAREALARVAAAGPSNERRKSMILALVGAADGLAVRALAERLASSMRALGAEVAVLGAEAAGSAPSHLHALEVEHDFVLMAAERGDTDFIDWSRRQMDRLILVGGPGEPPRGAGAPTAPPGIRAQRLIDVVLLHPPGSRPQGAARWLDAFDPARLFHIRAGEAADEARLARVYSGNSVALALGGGGARAYAHVGVVRALHELGVPIDFVAGTSMGAVIAAGLAMGWDDAEMDRRVRAAFVESSPLSDIAFPILAMTRGRVVDRRLAEHFGDVDIADLWRPFLCVSTDLTIGGMHVHRRGPLRRALRASLSLPGVLPPAVESGHVLVDGALVRNLPADLVREQHDGVTIGVDVASAEGLEPDDLLLKPSGWRWLASGAWLRGPPIVSVLIRSATLPSFAAAAQTQEDLVAIEPQVAGVGLQDWKAYDVAVASGYSAAMAAAETLTALRR